VTTEPTGRLATFAECERCVRLQRLVDQQHENMIRETDLTNKYAAALREIAAYEDDPIHRRVAWIAREALRG